MFKKKNFKTIIHPKNCTLIFLFFISVFYSNAQTAGCKDSAFTNRNSYCTAEVNPVCGCDGVTYLNACYAINYGGILNNSYTGGMCPGTDFVFYIYPNPVLTSINLKLQMAEGVSSVTLLIASRWGEIMYQSSIARSSTVDGRLDNYTIPEAAYYAPGLYFFIVYSNKQLKVQKFVSGIGN